jgi:hypothetical protein
LRFNVFTGYHYELLAIYRLASNKDGDLEVIAEASALLQTHHLHWMKDTENPEIGRMHSAMVYLLSQVEVQIQSLLDVLQAQLDKE